MKKPKIRIWHIVLLVIPFGIPAMIMFESYKKLKQKYNERRN